SYFPERSFKIFINGKNYTIFSDYKTETGQDKNSISKYPEFISEEFGKENFNLKEISPCRKNGKNGKDMGMNISFSEEMVIQQKKNLLEYPVNKFTKIENGYIDGSIIRIKRKIGQNQENIVILEAEEADFLSLEEKGKLIGYDESDGSEYIHFVKKAEYSFNVKNSEKFQVWYRVYFPVKGTWLHSELIDNLPPSVVYDSSQGDKEEKKWLWLKGPIYQLNSGIHKFILDGYHGGARLDKIIFAPLDFIPDNNKVYSPFYEEAPSEAYIETPSIIPPGIQKWSSLSIYKLLRNGEIEIFYSQDLGMTWNKLSPDGNLESLKWRDNYKGIKLRFVLKASPGGKSPILQFPILNFYGPTPVVISNDKVELKFSSIDGSLVGIQNLQNNVTCRVENPSSSCIFGVAILKEKRLVEYTGILKEQKIEENKRLVQKYDVSDGKIKVNVDIELTDGEKIIFKISVENKSEEPVVYVDFPVLTGLRIGDKSDDDYFFIPKVLGNLFKNPSNCPRLWQTTTNYERSVCMKWVDLWDISGGLYIASYDKSFRDTGIIVDKWDNNSIQIKFRKYIYVEKNQLWNSEDFCLGIHLGDWHWGADEYRKWAEKYISKPDNPDWLKKEFDGFSTDVGVTFPNYGFTGTLIQMLKHIGENGVIDIMGNRQGFDSNVGYCALFPCPNLSWGGVEEFSQTNEIIKKFGGHSIWYINWHLLNPNYFKLESKRIGGQAKKLLPQNISLPSFEWLEKNVVVSSSGNYIRPSPYEVYFETPLCNSTDEFINYKSYWAEKYVKEFKADGIYWDTMADGYDACFNPFHHFIKDLGQWSNGTTIALKKCIEKTRPYNPHVIYAGEGIGDINVSQYENLHIAEANQLWYEFVRYTFPDWIIVGGGFWAPGTHSEKENLGLLNYGFLTGVRCINPDVEGFYGKLPKEFGCDYGLKLLDLKRKIKQILYISTFIDTNGLKIRYPENYKGNFYYETENGLLPFPEVLAKRFVLKKGKTNVEIINTINTLDQKDVFLLLENVNIREIKKIWCFDIEGKMKEWDFEKEKEFIKIPFPISKAASLILVEKVEPLIYVDFPIYVSKDTPNVPIKVKLLNLNNFVMKGNLYIKGDDDFLSEKISFGPLQPGEEKEYQISFKIKKELPEGRYEFEIFAEDENNLVGSRIFWVYIGNPLRLSIFENSEILGVDILLENFSKREIKGHCELIENEVFTTSDKKFPFEIKPGEKKITTIPLKLKKSLPLPYLAKFKIIYENLCEEMVKSIRPPIPNPDFEIDIAGDLYPDGWVAYGAGGCGNILPYNQYGLDNKEKYSGNYSLFLNPPIGKDSNLCYNVISALKQGKKYRFKIAIKKEIPSEKVFVMLNVTDPIYNKVYLTKSLGKEGNSEKWEVFETNFETPIEEIEKEK
ncbi:MAG: DUF6259 domain-containing protein, partial [Candidatus Ratteibacteria bacterium]